MSMNFRRALLRIAQEMSSRDLENLKFACRDVIPESRLDFIHSSKDVFLILEEKGLLSTDKLDYLARQLVDINRPQLLSHLESFGFHIPDQHSSSGPSQSSTAIEDHSLNSIESHFTRCLLALSQKLTAEEVDRLAFAWCGTHLSISPDKIFSAHQLFTLMSRKLALKPDNLQVLYLELSEMGRQDLCKIIEDYYQVIGLGYHGGYILHNGRNFTPSPSPSSYGREDSQTGYPYISSQDHLSQHYFPQCSRPTNLAFSSPRTSMSDLTSQISQMQLIPTQGSPPQVGGAFNGKDQNMGVVDHPGAPPLTHQPPGYEYHRPSSAASNSHDGSPNIVHYNAQANPPIRAREDREGSEGFPLQMKEEHAPPTHHPQYRPERVSHPPPQDVESYNEVHTLQKALDEKNKEVNELRGCLANVQVPAATLKHEDLYPMKKEPHGICLIINNYTFFQVDEQYERLNDRSGAQKDQENLVETFNFLKYKVELYENLSSDMMVDTLKEISSRDHSNYDSFVCCILTHGEEGQVFGADSKPVNLQDLTGILKATFTRSLINKPKLFFVQACRGDGEEKGVPIEKDGNSSLPVEADFLFGYATPTGKAAYRSRRHGSWFISELCQVFLQDSGHLPLGAMMKKVNRKVSDAYTKEGFKQCTEVVDRLRKDVLFFPTDENKTD